MVEMDDLSTKSHRLGAAERRSFLLVLELKWLPVWGKERWVVPSDPRPHPQTPSLEALLDAPGSFLGAKESYSCLCNKSQ